MPRLSDRAYKILLEEAKRCAAQDKMGSDVQLKIVLKRLAKLRQQSGDYAQKAELQQTVQDMFPQFDPKVIEKAAKANRPSGLGWQFKWGAIGVLGAVGLLWVANLPYPPIRRPVANVAPLVLLPSFLSMDRNYRGAIAKVEQADQLINQATSAADIELGAEKVTQAQDHLDALPVWFLGYEPKTYCTLFGCTWRFTVDEFEQARKQVGRMEAQVFQESNALTQLQEAETALTQAKQTYQTAGSEEAKQAAIAKWQTAIDQFAQLPPQTFAGQSAQQQLQAHQRDFQEVVGVAANTQTTSTFVSAAKAYAMQAAQLSQNPPHPASKWREIAILWEEAIKQLKQVSSDNKAGYVEAQNLMAQYQTNLSEIRLRETAERESVQALETAQEQIQRLLSSVPNNPDTATTNRMAADLQGIINQLEKVKPGTTAYNKAQDLLINAKAKLKELQ
ncbi:hypothetical protein PN462_09825 [Spirulina sp. CS-785/01]|uniref:hypothetical protein n=1 Tax=Spirulina sp. CS-785/01 TaxID=3021716 RepID=UPI002330E74D|nr:hypothetical protein [Spirulina sp. CS-785/01]MDB9313395.1 hypothetical protein [Spirulina sp. CS-785/01]